MNKIALALVGAFALALLLSAGKLVEVVDANHLVVIQYPTGTMKAVTEPGPTWQWFGSVASYERRAEYRFGDKGHAPLRIRFNDGGHADLVGAVSWEMPTSHELLLKLQREFGSQEAVEQQMLGRALANAVYFTGPMMSSTESSGERRAEMLQHIDDQARQGVYQTTTRTTRDIDPLTKQERTIIHVEIERDARGLAKRSQVSAMQAYGINLLQLSVNDIKYDEVVEKQIAERQKSITQVQIARANATRAEQEKLTVEAQGASNAARAKWEQETIKAQKVTEAEQRLAVAALDRQAAEQEKQRQILLGQGESERKRLVMSADGALEKKLEAWVQVNNKYAEAIQNYEGNWVPQTVMGQSNGGQNGAQALIDMFTAKTARDLQLDMSIKK